MKIVPLAVALFGLYICVRVYGEVAVEEKHFVIVIATYNNAKKYGDVECCIRNIRSVLNQRYENFEVRIVDDASTDETFELIKSYVYLHPRGEHVVQLHKNENNRGALQNLHQMITACSDNSIIITLDGDDWLFNEHVLSKLNSIYHDPDVWLTYGSFVEYPSGEKSYYCALPQWVIEQNAYREYAWNTSHLRSFYAALYKKIEISDLLCKRKGKLCFIPMAWDMAIMFPMLEMAGNHSKFVEDVLYVYNMANPINDFKKNFDLSQICDAYARSRQPYKPLQRLFNER